MDAELVFEVIQEGTDADGTAPEIVVGHLASCEEDSYLAFSDAVAVDPTATGLSCFY